MAKVPSEMDAMLGMSRSPTLARSLLRAGSSTSTGVVTLSYHRA